MINGLNSDYYELNGLRDMRIDYINDSKGEYFEDVESNIQDQINNLSDEHGGNYNLINQYAITLSGNVNNYYYDYGNRLNTLDYNTSFITQGEEGSILYGTTTFDRLNILYGDNYFTGTTYFNNVDVIQYITSISGALWTNYQLDRRDYNLNNQYSISLSDKIYYNYQLDGYQYNLNNQYSTTLSNLVYYNHQLDRRDYNLNNQYSITLSNLVYYNHQLDRRDYNLNNQYSITLSNLVYYNHQLDRRDYNLNNQYEISLSNKIYYNYQLDGYQYNLNNQYLITLSSYINYFYYDYGANITSINSNINSIISTNNSQAGDINTLYDRTDANTSSSTGNSVGLGLLGFGTVAMGVAGAISLGTIQEEILVLAGTLEALAGRVDILNYTVQNLKNSIDTLNDKTRYWGRDGNTFFGDMQIRGSLITGIETENKAQYLYGPTFINGSLYGKGNVNIAGNTIMSSNAQILGNLTVEGTVKDTMGIQVQFANTNL